MWDESQFEHRNKYSLANMAVDVIMIPPHQEKVQLIIPASKELPYVPNYVTRILTSVEIFQKKLNMVSKKAHFYRFHHVILLKGISCRKFQVTMQSLERVFIPSEQEGIPYIACCW